ERASIQVRLASPNDDSGRKVLGTPPSAPRSKRASVRHASAPPTHGAHFRQSASDTSAEAGNAKWRSALGVSVFRALGTSACARRTIRPEHVVQKATSGLSSLASMRRTASFARASWKTFDEFAEDWAAKERHGELSRVGGRPVNLVLADRVRGSD